MIYLASASPRRQALLRQLGVAFEAIAPNLEEVPRPDEAPREYVARVARAKAHHVERRLREQKQTMYPVLGADTEVVLDGKVVGKPRDRQHGIEMLHLLSGRTHEVLSGLCVLHDGREYTALNISRVTFRALADAEIAAYWDTDEPVGKAGAYAIQGRAAAFIERLEGSYSGVMGLPLYELAGILREIRA